MAPNVTWHRTADGLTHYTSPLQFTIELLPNGLFRVFHYGPGLSSLHRTLVDAFKYCGSRP